MRVKRIKHLHQFFSEQMNWRTRTYHSAHQILGRIRGGGGGGVGSIKPPFSSSIEKDNKEAFATRA